MKQITIEIQCRLPADKKTLSLQASPGATVAEVLAEAGLTGISEAIVVYNGQAVCPDDKLTADGVIIILPLLCGG
ncbi:hypothetical protein [Sporolituus thermophilus]|uniref:Antitoxin component PasI (RatB) of the RatAB toxin-antitoxin module, ubiquitin-RnfH superfamily n=1 Tax=Sporolituus thermophilus DSM 23256 TaxID=1123285 RepID=A0A1G7HRN4_9FIRM|nr:hypothetical protein [Sporolituus thermophilus]SDF03177.1 Putative antitoxin component PasI (RatB) of the RatAB toxin-antitoxin module, ubiquitin-RnfH superfamily [Sporolituus thermophilus DSM 23256]